MKGGKMHKGEASCASSTCMKGGKGHKRGKKGKRGGGKKGK